MKVALIGIEGERREVDLNGWTSVESPVICEASWGFRRIFVHAAEEGEMPIFREAKYTEVSAPLPVSSR